MSLASTRSRGYISRSFHCSQILPFPHTQPPLHILKSHTPSPHRSTNTAAYFTDISHSLEYRHSSLATMQTTMLLLIMLFLISFLQILPVNAACCLSDAGGDCGDNSAGTPCCGYKKCNGFCCACQGVGIIRQVVEFTGENGKPSATTSTITAGSASAWTNPWTCREDHITKDPPPQIREATGFATSIRATSTGYTSMITTSPNLRERPFEPASECDDILVMVSGGSGSVTLEQYLKYFKVTNEHSPRYQTVSTAFHARDKDNNGVLTKDEIEELL